MEVCQIRPTPSGNVLSVRRVCDVAELGPVWDLRRRVYSEAGKFAPDQAETAADLALPSFHLLAFYSGASLVGSISVWVPELGSATPYRWIPSSLQASGLSDGRLPLADRSIEIGRLFLIREFRGSQAIIDIFRAVHEILRANEKDFLVITSDERLQSLYHRICFRPVGLAFQKTTQSGTPSRISVLVARHRHAGMYGFGNGPLKWALFMKPVINSMRARGAYRPSLRELLVYAIYAPFSPLARWALPRPKPKAEVVSSEVPRLA